MKINDRFATPSQVKFERHRIYLPADLLLAGGQNTVQFEFKNTYVTNSAGLHYYKDPKDQKVYIYSHLEPFFCHRFFPCFDQPSVRAALKLSVVVPSADWNLIANGEETAVKRTQVRSPEAQRVISESQFDLLTTDGYLWDFKECPPISSYIYCLCAGEFTEIKNQAADAPTPMRIFVRESKADYVDSAEVFRLISEGIPFYKVLFGYEFPFAKYDMIYVPEFRIGAMENVGAVTFTDKVLIPKDERTDSSDFMHAYIHLHELAHMWFGDLTTMHWWNDLWLKESFADFCSVTCMSETASIKARYPDPELRFLDFMANALSADLKPTTHPI